MGHEAFSCDLQPCSGGHPDWHIQGDVLEVLDDGWDMMVAHPECKFICLSSARWFGDERYPNREQDFEAGIEFFLTLAMRRLFYPNVYDQALVLRIQMSA